MSLTGCQCFCLSRGHFVDAALFIDEASLDHFEVQVTRHLCDEQHTDQLTYEKKMKYALRAFQRKPTF